MQGRTAVWPAKVGGRQEAPSHIGGQTSCKEGLKLNSTFKTVLNNSLRFPTLGAHFLQREVRLKSIQQFWIIPFVFFIMTHHPTFVLNYSLSFIIPTILVAQLQGRLRIRAVWTFHKFARDSQKSTKRFCISVNSKSSFHFDVFFYFWAICFGWMVS